MAGEGGGTSEIDLGIKPADSRSDALHYVLHGVKPDQKTGLAGNVDNSLDRVLAARPSLEQVLTVSEIDKTLNSVHQPANPHKVKSIVGAINRPNWGLEVWSMSDGLPFDENFYYTEEFIPYFEQGPSNLTGAPEKVVASQQHFRNMISNARASVAAAGVVQAQLPLDASEADRQRVQSWKENRSQILSTLIRAWGVERTALVFNNPQANADLKTNFDLLVQQLNDSHLSPLKPPVQDSVIRMNDFVEQNFWWMEEFGLTSAKGHTLGVAKAAEPLLAIAREWINRPEYKNRAAFGEAFDAKAALVRLKEVSASLPSRHEKSVFRKEAAKEIKKGWIRQVVTATKQIREAYEALAAAPNLAEGQKILEQRVRALTTSMYLTSIQRQEVARSAALLAQRAVNIKEFSSRHSIDNPEDVKDMARILFDFEPGGRYWIKPTTTSIQVTFEDPEDFARGHGGAEANLSDATYKLVNDELGREIPVVITRLHNWSELIQHEKIHAVYATKPDSQRQNFHPSYTNDYVYPGESDTEAKGKRLELLDETNVLPIIRNELVAYIGSGQEEAFIKGQLVESPLYELHANTAQILGLNSDVNVRRLEEIKSRSRQQAGKMIETAFSIKKELGLSNEDCAILLAVLPIDQWHHMATILRGVLDQE